jgi:hypothetical protein
VVSRTATVSQVTGEQVRSYGALEVPSGPTSRRVTKA